MNNPTNPTNLADLEAEEKALRQECRARLLEQAEGQIWPAGISIMKIMEMECSLGCMEQWVWDRASEALKTLLAQRDQEEKLMNYLAVVVAIKKRLRHWHGREASSLFLDNLLFLSRYKEINESQRIKGAHVAALLGERLSRK
jgi:hypothetical protein